MIPHSTWPESRNAPPNLEIVRRFINTRSIETGADLLASKAEFCSWAAGENVVELGHVSRAELAAIHDLRALLRGAIESRSTPTELHRFAPRFPVELRFSTTPEMSSPVGGVAQFFTTILVSTWFGLLDETWNRLTACANDRCRWIVYDNSKSKTVQWCCDQACGGRMRAQRYRDRRAEFERTATR